MWMFIHRNPHASSFRFFVITLVTLMPLGPHVMKYSLTSIASDIKDDKRLNLSYAQLGAFQSAVLIPLLILPLLGGVMIDVKGSKFGTLLVSSPNSFVIDYTNIALALISSDLIYDAKAGVQIL